MLTEKMMRELRRQYTARCHNGTPPLVTKTRRPRRKLNASEVQRGGRLKATHSALAINIVTPPAMPGVNIALGCRNSSTLTFSMTHPRPLASRSRLALAGHGNAALQPDVSRRGTDLDDDRPVLHRPVVRVRIPVAERRRRELERNRTGLAGPEGHPAEPAQVPARTWDRRVRIPYVQLHDLVAAARARVGHVHRHGQAVVTPQRVAAHPKPVVAEGGIAQPVSEGIQRHPLEEPVGASCHAVVFERR